MQPILWQWLTYQVKHGRPFTGTKTVEYYLDAIRRLRDYLEPMEAETILGVTLTQYLDDNENST
jgi:hypothetical protein